MTVLPENMPCPPNADSNGAGEEFVVKTDPQLEAEGWERRNLSDPDRAKETVELYESLGYEVHVQKLKPADFDAKCVACALSVCSSYVVIYTRKK